MAEDMRSLYRRGLVSDKAMDTLSGHNFARQIDPLAGSGGAPIRQGVFPIVTTPMRAESREAMGFPHIERVDANAFRQVYENHNDEPLAWSPGRTDNIKKLTDAGTPMNDYPRVGLSKDPAIEGGQRLGVDDGRHRIGVAADNGQAIDVAVGSPKEGAALQALLGSD